MGLERAMIMGYLEWMMRPENRSKVFAKYLEDLTWFEKFLTRDIKSNENYLELPSKSSRMKQIAVRSLARDRRYLKMIQKFRKEAIQRARQNGIPLPPQTQLAREKRLSKEGMR